MSQNMINPDVPRPLHAAGGGEVELLQHLQHPPLLLYLNIVHIEQDRVVADQVRTYLIQSVKTLTFER